MKNYLVAIITILVIGVLAVGGFAIWSNTNKNQTPVTTTTTTDNSVTAGQVAAPSVVTNPVTTPYISTVLVKGAVNPNGAFTTYWYEYGLSSSLGSKTQNYLVGSGSSDIYTPAYIIGLSSNTNYYFRLSAQNSLGTVSGTTYSFKTNVNPPPVGSAPTVNTIGASDLAKNSANLHGQINPNNSETTYWFEYGSSANLGSVTAFRSTGSDNSPLAVAVSISDLKSLTQYFFRLNAQNRFGTVNGQILNFTTKGPASTSSPTVTTNTTSDITGNSAELHANVNPNGAMTTYWFEYSNNSLLSKVVALKTPEQSLNDGSSAVNVLADISSLHGNTKYFVRAVAKNQYGTVKGDVVSFTTRK